MQSRMERSCSTGLLAVIGVVAAAAAAPAWGQQPVAYVDVAHIVNQSERSAAIRAQLREEFADRLAELKAVELGLQEVRARLAAERPDLTPEELADRMRGVEESEIRYQRQSEDLERDVEGRREELFNPFEAGVLGLIERIREERRIGIVFSKQGGAFLAVDPALDLTGEVLARLDDAP